MPQRVAGQLREDEKPEFPFRGPFGGIQSEVPSDAIENVGFLDTLNVLFRKAVADVRPSYTALTALGAPTENINGIADFFTSARNRIQVIMTPTRLLKWNGAGAGTWTLITGGPLTGTASDLYSWTVVGHKLLFSQGVDNVKLWDGITASYANASASAVPARFLTEIATHLVMGDTLEGGNRLHQRIRWTGAGDPTDWTSFNAGTNDLYNELGPINGLNTLYGLGYAYQQFGITRIKPTGIGTRPFDFQKVSSRGKGNIAPYSLATYGEQIACYVGKDNIYMFNGTESIPIGDHPVEGSMSRMGARKRIMAELLQADFSLVYGYISSSINGQDFNAYWLVIPTGSVWVFNFDELNWTRFVYNKTPRTLGNFNKAGEVRIMDLVGTIADQTWTASNLTNNNPLETMLIGFTDMTPGHVDFTNYSESAWHIKSGQISMNDRRHTKTILKFRTVWVDRGAFTFTLQVENENGQIESKTETIGSGTGLSLIKIVEIKINGTFLRWTLSGAAGAAASLAEITPIYDVGGEVRG